MAYRNVFGNRKPLICLGMSNIRISNMCRLTSSNFSWLISMPGLKPSSRTLELSCAAYLVYMSRILSIYLWKFQGCIIKIHSVNLCTCRGVCWTCFPASQIWASNRWSLTFHGFWRIAARSPGTRVERPTVSLTKLPCSSLLDSQEHTDKDPHAQLCRAHSSPAPFLCFNCFGNTSLLACSKAIYNLLILIHFYCYLSANFQLGT